MSARDRALQALLRTYKLTLSPVFMALGARCRFTPTCSEYAVEAVRRHGFVRGGLMGAGRLLRCRPGGGCGDDPVPHACGGKALRRGGAHA